MTFLIILLALLIDYLLGEPKKYHPLVGFGKWADQIETRLNRCQTKQCMGRSLGLAAFLLTVLPVVVFIYVLRDMLPNAWGWVLDIVVLALAIGHKSLIEHALAVSRPLLSGDLLSARKSVAMIVSRDTADLNENEISKAAIESVLENGSDAIFAAIFWYLLAGLPGLVFYRLSNTLDAMWGYKTQRFNHFGWFTAKTDDFLNLIPARLTAFSYSLSGHFSSAIKCWRSQGRQWYSINAGPVMAAGAGALQVLLGGDSIYHGKTKRRIILGCGQLAQADDIKRALDLLAKSIVIWLSVIFTINLVMIIF